MEFGAHNSCPICRHPLVEGTRPDGSTLFTFRHSAHDAYSHMAQHVDVTAILPFLPGGNGAGANAYSDDDDWGPGWSDSAYEFEEVD